MKLHKLAFAAVVLLTLAGRAAPAAEEQGVNDVDSSGMQAERDATGSAADSGDEADVGSEGEPCEPAHDSAKPDRGCGDETEPTSGEDE